MRLELMISWLDLKKPVDLTIKTRKGKDCDAYYLPNYSDRNGRLKGHKIVVYLTDSGRTLETLVAHELIHAWQEENNKQEFHGKHFQRLAESMGSAFGLEKIYWEGVDEI